MVLKVFFQPQRFYEVILCLKIKAGLGGGVGSCPQAVPVVGATRLGRLVPRIAEAAAARDLTRCSERPVLSTGWVEESEPVCLLQGKVPDCGAEVAPGQQGCWGGEEGFFQAMPAGGKCEGQRSALS